jgi:Glyoxalase-like domain
MAIRLGSTVINCADDYVVMADPEGNEFCVCAVADP